MIGKRHTLGSLMADGTLRLQQAGCDTPRLDARLLLSAATGMDSGRIMAFTDETVEDAQVTIFDALIDRRRAREPVSRILGRRDFWRYSFALNEATLDPRPDSETLVAWCIEKITAMGGQRWLVDFGTGTGCLLLSVLADVPDATGMAIDISPRAIDCARDNAVALGVDGRCDFYVSDWDASLPSGHVCHNFDAVISNPPYIARPEMAGLSAEVRDYDPEIALTDGADGLSAYRILARVAYERLRPGGFVMFEIGRGQEADVSALLEQAGFAGIAYRKDLGGIIRCVAADKP
ncbi:peptide chain release factor N(5)-glutamine methyltransferase [Thalassospira sp.]|uniref:peptide chain release factor N(5)-glutamine methyltransferase n=1 Tax=Thalassospira sp. TaxID=1912094 RepID=UPI002734665A|nr:peptide chain release factor N(5)-glutamine methyltransferase [Thalassospira sp.]MDP2698414.1 peptide chain release factor N(5)-glutamine methyltransferase [Thalassospira sp.]